MSEEKINYRGKRVSATAPINYILKELLVHKHCVTMSNIIHMDGHLYDDIVEDIKNYLELNKDA